MLSAKQPCADTICICRPVTFELQMHKVKLATVFPYRGMWPAHSFSDGREKGWPSPWGYEDDSGEALAARTPATSRLHGDQDSLRTHCFRRSLLLPRASVSSPIR